MSFTEINYMPRLIDCKISKYLIIFDAISIEGPKWCGKTWTGLNHANSGTYLTDKRKRNLASIDPKYIFRSDHPQFIDEWQIVQEIWDAVRHECDRNKNKGKFILTGFTSLTKQSDAETSVFHTGTSRIADINMYPMSLYEAEISKDEASISDVLEGHVNEEFVRKVELQELAKYIIMRGWPENINMSEEDIGILFQLASFLLAN